MKWKPHDNIVWVDEVDEIRMYDAQSNQFQNLNETGAKIWRLIVQGHDDAHIVDQLGQDYNVQRDEEKSIIRQDVHEFIDNLAAMHLIVADDQRLTAHAT